MQRDAFHFYLRHLFPSLGKEMEKSKTLLADSADTSSVVTATIVPSHVARVEAQVVRTVRTIQIERTGPVGAE